VNAGLVAVLIGLGAGAIALWIDIRFPRLSPKEMAKAVLHVAASVAVVYATSPAMQMVTSSDDPRIVLLGVFAIGFPSVVYCLLAGLWLIKVAQRMLSGNLR
jgi:ABC-type uncharacterized transport system permease subunit